MTLNSRIKSIERAVGVSEAMNQEAIEQIVDFFRRGDATLLRKPPSVLSLQAATRLISKDNMAALPGVKKLMEALNMASIGGTLDYVQGLNPKWRPCMVVVTGNREPVEEGALLKALGIDAVFFVPARPCNTTANEL